MAGGGRRAECAADGGGMKPGFVLANGIEGHRQAIGDLATEGHGAEEGEAATVHPLARRQACRHHHRQRMDHRLGMVGLDIAGVAHGAVGQRRVRRPGAEPVADHHGLRPPSALVDEAGDPGTGGHRRLGRGEQGRQPVAHHDLGPGQDPGRQAGGVERRDEAGQVTGQVRGPGSNHGVSWTLTGGHDSVPDTPVPRQVSPLFLRHTRLDHEAHSPGTGDAGRPPWRA